MYAHARCPSPVEHGLWLRHQGHWRERGSGERPAEKAIGCDSEYLGSVEYAGGRHTDLGRWRMADGGLEMIVYDARADALSTSEHGTARATASVWLSQSANARRLGFWGHPG